MTGPGHLLIRHRVNRDLPSCVALLRAVRAASGYPVNCPQHPEAWLDEPGTVAAWVAIGSGGEICGQVSITCDTPAVVDAPAELSRLFVDPAATGRGIGGALVQAAAGHAAARQWRLMLTVVDTSAPAIALYRRHGWQLVRAGIRADWSGPDGAPIHLQEYRAPAP